jgi:hypothetical protein
MDELRIALSGAMPKCDLHVVKVRVWPQLLGKSDGSRAVSMSWWLSPPSNLTCISNRGYDQRKSERRSTDGRLERDENDVELREIVSFGRAGGSPSVVPGLVKVGSPREVCSWMRRTRNSCARRASRSSFAARPGTRGWSDHAALAAELLADDPVAIV